jgi:hypothetical protein
MNTQPKITLVVLVVLGLVWLAIRSTPTNPIAIIKVVDTAGKPVAGALLRPDGLRPKRINGHWSWSEDNAVKPTTVTTDALGIARVPYPRYVFEKAETGEISFQVEHPDYCSDRPFRVVSATPPANASLKTRADFIYRWLTGRVVTRPVPVILQPADREGERLLGLQNQPAPDIHPQLASCPFRARFWQPPLGSLHESPRQPGTNAVRVIYLLPLDGSVSVTT